MRNNNNLQRRYCRTAIFIALAMAGTTVHSQSLEEVVVTAQKREQNLQDVPVSIEVVSGESMAKAGISDFNELSSISSSYNINTSAGTNQAFVRGVGSNINGNTVDSVVSLYIDGVFLPRNYALQTGFAQLNDLESLQILKGPQGTLYGRNATAGAIVVETYKPQIGDEFSGRVSVTAGDYGVFKGGIRLSGGISDTLAGTIAYTYSESDGYIENVRSGDDYDDKDAWTASAKLVFEPNDRSSFEFSAFVSEDDNRYFSINQVGYTDDELANLVFPGAGLNNSQAAYANTVLAFVPALGIDAGEAAPTVVSLASGIRFPGDSGQGTTDNHVTAFQLGLADQIGLSAGPDLGDNTAGAVSENLQLSLRASFNFDKFDLVSITAYGDFDQSSTVDVFRALPETLPDLRVLAPLSPDPETAAAVLGIWNQGNIGFTGSTDSDFASQEFYVVSTDSPIDWIAGFYYFKEEFDGAGVTNDLFGIAAPSSFSDMTSEAWAVYGEATIPFGDALSATVGLRYTDDENEITNRNDEVGSPAGVVGDRKRSVEDEKITYTAKLSYAAENTTFYGGVTTGFKAGIHNTGDPNSDPAEPEDITSYEVGFKSELADNSIRLTGAAFFYDYENIQLNVLDAVNGSTRVANKAEAEILGLEFDVNALIGDHTTIFGGATFLDSEFTENAVIVATGQTQFIDGNTLPFSPDVSLVLGIDYTFPLYSGEMSLNASANYNSGVFFDQTNLIGSAKDGDEDDSFATAKASVTYYSEGDTWMVQAYVNNLTDEDYYASGFDSGGFFQMANAARPRHYGVTLTYNF